MTGAPMPAGADTVYPQEVVERAGDRVRIGPTSPRASTCACAARTCEAGRVVLTAGTVLRPQEIGLVASLGVWQLLVHQRPRVALLSTGDEVAEPGTPRKPGQIYDSNRFTLRGLVHARAAPTIDLGIVPDVRDVLRARLREAAGDRRRRHHLGRRVGRRLRPRQGGARRTRAASTSGRWRCSRAARSRSARIGPAHFFGLPGNPVASMLTFMLFVRPALCKLAGRRELFPPRLHARGDGADAQEAGPARVQARHPPLQRRRAGRCGPPGPRAPASSPRWSPATASSCSTRSAATWRRASSCRSSRSRWPELDAPRDRDPADRDRHPRWCASWSPTHARALAISHYADLRLEVVEGKFAGAENGESQDRRATTTPSPSACACSRATA